MDIVSMLREAYKSQNRNREFAAPGHLYPYRVSLSGVIQIRKGRQEWVPIEYTSDVFNKDWSGWGFCDRRTLTGGISPEAAKTKLKDAFNFRGFGMDLYLDNLANTYLEVFELKK